MARFARRRGASEWIGLGEASRLLGVAPGTLRRWSDSGRVPAFTTPGGHRRYRRSSLESLIGLERSVRPSLVRSGLTTSRLARAYRREARAAGPQLPWLVQLTDEQRDWFRDRGRRVAQALLRHLDADAGAPAQARLAEATSEAAEYGRLTAGLGISLGQAVEGFLQFRRPFLHQLALTARTRGFDTPASTDLMEAAERAMDRLLVAVMAAHSVVRAGRPLGGGARPAAVESEGLR